jgi:hypothetical protein
MATNRRELVLARRVPYAFCNKAYSRWAMLPVPGSVAFSMLRLWCRG